MEDVDVLWNVDVLFAVVLLKEFYDVILPRELDLEEELKINRVLYLVFLCSPG